MSTEELIEITAAELYKLVDSESIELAAEEATKQIFSLNQGTRYNVIISGAAFPPKEILRIIAKLKGYRVIETSLNGGQANKPFERLGYQIAKKGEYPIANSSRLQPQISKYQRALEDLEWVEKHLSKKISFTKKIRAAAISFEQETEMSSFIEANGNFIIDIGFNVDLTTIREIAVLLQLSRETISIENEALTQVMMNPSSASLILSLLDPHLYVPYALDSRLLYPRVSIDSNFDLSSQQSGYRSFRFYQQFNRNIQNFLKNSHLDKNLIKHLFGIDELDDIIWNFITMDFIEFVSQKVYNLGQDTASNTQLNPQNPSFANMNTPLNQILFGAPGTGKTFLTKKLAVEIIDEKEYDQNNRQAINIRYNELVKSKQIVFTTFHQSLGYEDFIEGIKPETNEDNVVYEVKDGIFKTIAKTAIEENRKKTRKLYNNFTYPNYDEAWANLVSEARAKIDEGVGLLELETLSKRKNKVVDISSQGNLIIKPESSKDLAYGVSYGRAKKLFDAFPNLSEVKNIDKEFRQVIGGSNSTTYWSVIKYLQQWIEENGKVTVDEIEQPIKKFVIIIDEINRGNVSAIFGELITLIEDNKRFTTQDNDNEEYKIILPYSKDYFVVPDNLYIIGTMNTADRSVEALDSALRRRFSFIEMRPNPEIISATSKFREVDLARMLYLINERIELLLDKDHQIGHAYLIGIDNLQQLQKAFYNKVIPLLEEYFYGDFGKIGLVLGSRFIIEKPTHTIFARNFDYGDDIDLLKEKKVYKITAPDSWDINAFTSIYE